MRPPLAGEMAASPGSRRPALGYSPSRSSGSTRMYGLGPGGAPPQKAQRGAGTGGRKPPEPLRRAVADSLSSTSTSSLYSSSIHGGTSVVASEAARILRDFIANPSSTDLAYSVLVEHALAERDRSPAVVPKCVSLLKRYLLRYVPKLHTLRQIDQFCVNIIAECESVTSRRGSLWSSSLSQPPGTSSLVPSSSASSFASDSLVKSLHYVRSLVGRHIPKLSFQPVGPMASGAPKQLLPSLSSLLSQSFTSQLSPQAIQAKDSLDFKQDAGGSSSELSRVGNAGEANLYISFDLLNWRWPGKGVQQTSSLLKESNPLRSLDVHNHGFLEVGAAALLAGDLETKIKDQPWKHFITEDLPDIGVLQPSTATTASSFASIHGHLKTITASKRMKASPQQVWENVPISSFCPRAHPLFQYRHYSEQQALKLSFAEIQEVITEVCLEASIPSAKQLSTTSLMTKRNAQPATNVAVSVLIKLVIDMYMMDPATAAPLTLYMLEGMLSSDRSASRARAFDFILNLGIHAQLLEPMFPEDQSAPEAVGSPKDTDGNNVQAGVREDASSKSNAEKKFDSPVDKFESWLLIILSEVLRLLVQTEEREEIVWASALSCLFYLVCDKGQILKSRLEALDIRVVKTLLEISREYSWAEVVHRNLICMLTNMFYLSSNIDSTFTNPESPIFLTEQVDLLGGIEFICLEYSLANSSEEKRNLFLILFDYVLNQINESCLTSGMDAYAHDEIEPVISMLTLTGAPEAFYIAVKHGMEGIGELLKTSASSSLLRLPNYERLYMVLEKVTRKLDIAISSFTRLDSEFSYMFQLTKTYKSFSNIEDGSELDKARFSWCTLHSLLHSERSAYRYHGYIWLVQLLVSEINESKNGTIWFNTKKLQEQIVLYGNQDAAYLEVPLSISMFCGLLKSKSNSIRWGFLYVLEKLLMMCKLYLHESDQQLPNHKNTSNNVSENRINIANAIIDIMSAALSLVVLNVETDHINILKMCDILFTQLCLRCRSTNEVSTVDFRRSYALFHPKSYRHNGEVEGHLSGAQEASRKNQQKDEQPRNVSMHGTDEHSPISSTASMAAMLLQGYAIAPTQLVARTPVSLFYWPLIQLAGAATDDIALGVAVGSKGRGNIPGGTSDIRAALLLLLIGKCTEDPEAFVEIEGKEFFRGLLEDTDSRVAYYSSAFLLKRIMTEVPETYQRMLQSLIFKAQQSNNEKLLENPFLQMRGILQLSNDLGAQL